MESNQIRLTDDELKEINDLRLEILDNVESLGRLNIKKHFLQRELSEIEFEIASHLQKSEELDGAERSLTSRVIEKYGEGNLNFQTGEYTKK